MAEENMTFAESGRILEAVRVLEALEKSGEINDSQLAALNKFRDKQKTAEQARTETIAKYRGVQSGATMNLSDEITGAYNAATELFKSRDIEGAKEAYAKFRDLSRKRDEAAQVLAPEQFAQGEGVGSVVGAMTPAAGAARLMRGMSMLPRMAIGGVTGALSTALPQFAGGEGGFVNRVSEVSPISAGVGAGIGGSAPAVGAVTGGIVRGAQNLRRGVEGFGAGATQRVARSLNRAEASGADVEAYLDQIGPEGMIADIKGSPQQLAQGLASMQGEGSDILQRSVRERGEGAGARIEDVMTRRVDEPEAAFQKRVALAQERSSVLGPMYDAATQSGQKFQVDAIRSGISFIGKDAATNVKKRLNAAIKDLGSEGEISAERLHNARAALSDAMFKAKIKGEGGVVANLKPILAEVDSKLDSIPDYAAARTGYASNMLLSGL